MTAPADRKVVLVTRRTRLEELLVRHHTLAQAQFYIEHLNADFSDYLTENAAYARSLSQVVSRLQAWGRYQLVDRTYLPNFVFAQDDIVVALGQDGMVANTMKYLAGQPLIGVNPEPSRWDGVLLPFESSDLAALIGDVSSGKRPMCEVTMAEARLSDGQRLRAVNDLFIGPRTHTSALYEIEHGAIREVQSSSGLIVATGLGSTAWIKSIVTGSIAVARAVTGGKTQATYAAKAWDSNTLTFAVREPFPTRASQASLVFGEITSDSPLKLRSRMPENGVIFSDGMDADFLRFTAGMEATIGVASERGCLVM